MRTIEEKIASLNPTSIWYFAKQDSNFDNAFRAVQIVDKLGQRWFDEGTNAWNELASKKGFEPNHRILSVAQLLGLLTKETAFKTSSYSKESPTKIFHVLSQYEIGSEEYNALKTEQLLKLRMNAITDTRNDNADYEISPVLFIFEVFWELLKHGVTHVSIDDFYTYIMTCKSHEELDECVSYILTENKPDNPYINEFKSSSRIATLIQSNLKLIDFTQTDVSINSSFSDYFGYFFNGAYSSFVNIMKYVVGDINTYEKVLTNPIELSVNFLKTKAPLPERFQESFSIPTYSHLLPILSAIATKPFILLAGISGTGKSRLVKELAFMTCPKEEGFRTDETTPYNYCLIEVKPNWHDSSELLGYYNALDNKYELTPFIRFVYRALKNPNVPFFACLDEMNLAPVEQYFAEYLSVLETRTKTDKGIVSAALLKKEIFGGIANDNYSIDEDKEIISFLKENGLHLPSNLFVIGTVNMDDTTHQFSRKVIDRAFTIEMNGENLKDMFNAENANALTYRDEVLPLSAIQSKFVSANEVFEDSNMAQYEDTIKEEVPKHLNAINNILKDTPFKVSYRVQNELILYLANLIEQAGYPEDITPLIGEATLAVLLQKILPRIQGDDKVLGKSDGKDVFTELKSYVEQHFILKEKSQDNENSVEVQSAPSLYTPVIDKLDQMHTRLTNSYFANFF